MNKWPIERYHNHPLIFHYIISGDHEGTINASSDNNSIEVLLKSYSCSFDQGAVCDACVQPVILTPFWGCVHPDCRFRLHDFWANIPSAIVAFGYLASLYQDSSKYFFNSTFPCFFRQRPCNGLGYRTNINRYNIGIADLDCASTPIATTHASHNGHDHILLLTMQPKAIPLSCCREIWPLDPTSFHPSSSRTYRCISCDFAVHAGCSLLPRKASHYKFDKHPLELMFTESWTRKDSCLCEVCEQDIEQQYWFYYFAECEQSFHVQCIPSVGLLSKIKFGGTLDVSCHPDHPVALTWMLMVGSQRCGCCKEMIKGFGDEMSFYCSHCEFWEKYVS